MRNRGRTKLRFQKPVPGNDGFGGNTAAGGWGNDIDIGVLLKPSRGTENEQNGAVVGRQIYECELRAQYVFSGPRIDSTWRAFDPLTSRYFNISAVAQNDLDIRFVRLTLTVGEPS